MKGAFYKLPIDFNSVMQKKELEKTSIEHSIAQQIILLATTTFGECKFDETFGSKIWEIDFDLLMNENTLKEIISKTMKQSLLFHEKRIKVNELKVELSETMYLVDDVSRAKKKVDIIIEATIKSTNRDFDFRGYFFVGPLSYK
ncbi:GPW/gp25 family protein [Flavobacterium johnsoniae]|jgi:phage baseplate assembly protein W|uniref:Gene 25-like lysozyme n=2 Tax=Flavobacterium johnsoniae TaxID=986 RepID=A0A1M6UNG0_FLAJO|nr:GPW/gp25 family protein [Flavobacterium johnsoniae]ABQ06279.1 GPW/gp25 family protein [Flavobacterium johnsoniae UW101]OXE98251.1 lysozyme [Flavobacterium johnsoniae UW101]WQG82027.1 GPW/gp25 family protein [Flavobacterium johnsoniae UW101]SHG81181.1 Gene 25-like lysozyme [Flavobacterium johnsoniae]SHK70717.1 Gene 25-like lysozyme [Flavobacterium johnsoniae]